MKGPRGARRAVARGATALLVAALAASSACRREPEAPQPPKDDLETVDVAPPPDALVDPSKDVQEVRRAETFSGVLPGDFPAGLPLPTGASLVDQGPRWVVVLVGRPPADVRAQYPQQVRAAGWQADAAGADAWTLRKGGVRARARVGARGPSSELRIDY